MKAIHGMCFDCVVEMEHKVKLEKKWDEYEKEKLRQNALSWLKEAERDKNLIAEELSKVEFANSFGDSEKWDTGVTKEQILQKIEEEFENFRKDFIEKLEKELSGNNGEEVEQSENNS
jgi:ribosomal protein L9